MLRRLRIAASVLFALLTVALVVLWVRSYYVYDNLEKVTQTRVVQLRSALGCLSVWQQAPRGVGQSDLPVLLKELSVGRTFTSGPIGARPYPKNSKTFMGFGWHRRGATSLISVPWLFLVLLCVSLGAAPWSSLYSARFSLRTLLIATTLVAVLLGALVWAAR